MENEIKEFWAKHEQVEFDVGKEKAKLLYLLLMDGFKIVEVGLSKRGVVSVIVQKRCC